jgi:hypothetical protein
VSRSSIGPDPFLPRLWDLAAGGVFRLACRGRDDVVSGRVGEPSRLERFSWGRGADRPAPRRWGALIVGGWLLVVFLAVGAALGEGPFAWVVLVMITGVAIANTVVLRRIVGRHGWSDRW